jgi:predicted aspartyl protease
MIFSYDSAYFPPAPMIELAFSSATIGRMTPGLRAFVDSGADATLVPRSLLEEIQATFADDAYLRSQWGERRRVRLYVVDVKIGDWVLPGVTVVGDDRSSELIVGRDVLNRLRILLDGPTMRLQVQP